MHKPVMMVIITLVKKKIEHAKCNIDFFFFEQMMTKSLETTNIIKRDKKYPLCSTKFYNFTILLIFPFSFLQEHIQEVLNKWQSIDDEIWAKIIVLERNRRVAKAYARAPVLTVNGSDDGFDGFRIGLAGFENPMRDPKTEDVKRQIGQGCKIKMDDSGNILVKRIAKSNVYVKLTSEENAIASDILKLPNGCLESEKPVKLFDMKKFQQNVSREMRRAYPDRRKLECQCISAIAFVRNENDILDCPCWIMLINIVAMDMLKSKMPPSKFYVA